MGAEESTDGGGRSCSVPLFSGGGNEDKLKKENKEKDAKIAELEKALAMDSGEREKELIAEIKRLREPQSLNMDDEALNDMDKEYLVKEIRLLKQHIADSTREKSEVELFAEEERKILAEAEDALRVELQQVSLQKDALQKKLEALSNSQQRMDAKLQVELHQAREELNNKGLALDELKKERDQLEADYQDRVSNIKTIHETSQQRMIQRQSELQARLAQQDSGSYLPPLAEMGTDDYNAGPMLPEDEFHRKMAALAAKVDSLHSQGSQQLTQQVQHLEADIAASKTRKAAKSPRAGPSQKDSVKWPSQSTGPESHDSLLTD